MSSFSSFGRFVALLSVPAVAATAQLTPQFHLAYAVDTQELVSGNPNPFYHTIRIRDHHEDHYHNFAHNPGLSDHDQAPLSVMIGAGYDASFTLGAWNYSPDIGVSTRYVIPDDGAGAHFHLELLSITGPGLGDESYLQVGIREVGDPSFGSFTVGTDAHLHWGADFNEIGFALSSGATLGRYTAIFRVIDEEGLYNDSPTFSIYVDAVAVPEPSAFAALAGAAALGLAATRRRRRA